MRWSAVSGKAVTATSRTDEMASMSWWMREVERKAYERLRQLRERGFWDGAPPIPIDHVLEHLLGLSISWEEIEEEPGELIMACLRPETREVVLNERHLDLFREKPGLLRFSKGHEAGHADVFALAAETEQLTMAVETRYQPRRRSATRGPVSVIAERLRGLAPDVRTEVMRELVARQRAKRQAGEDSPWERRSVDHYAAVVLMPEGILRDAARDRVLSRWPAIYELATAFEVTVTAMIVRLKELGLIFDIEDGEILVRNPAHAGQGELF